MFVDIEFPETLFDTICSMKPPSRHVWLASFLLKSESVVQSGKNLTKLTNHIFEGGINIIRRNNFINFKSYLFLGQVNRIESAVL